MTTIEILGYAAAVLFVLAFVMKGMAWLRYVAIAASLVLGAYGVIAAHYPVVGIAVVMLAANVWRLIEMNRLAGEARAAAAGAAAPVTLDWLTPYMQPRSAKKDEVLFRKGDAADAMYVVTAGRVRFVELGVEVGKGTLFGEMGVFSTDAIRTATAVAVEPASLLVISADKVRELYYQNPDFGFYLVGVITKRLMEDLSRAGGKA